MAVIDTNSREEGFSRAAMSLSGRVADLLCARVVVTDDLGILVALSEPRNYPPPARQEEPMLEVPVTLGGGRGRMTVYHPRNGEPTAPRVAEELVRMMASQSAASLRRADRLADRDKFLRDLLHGYIENGRDYRREAEEYGIDLTDPVSVIVVRVPGYIAARSVTGRPLSEAAIKIRVDTLSAAMERFFNSEEQMPGLYIDNSEVAFLKCSAADELGPWMEGEEPGRGSEIVRAQQLMAEDMHAHLLPDFGSNLSLGVGMPRTGAEGIARSYEDACLALAVGRRLTAGTHVYLLHGLGANAFVDLHDDELKQRLADHLLKPLWDMPEMIETLTVFFAENCYPSLAARRLSVHRNTLSYRLDRITALTGRDPRRFEDALQLRLALYLYSGSNRTGPLPVIDGPVTSDQ